MKRSRSRPAKLEEEEEEEEEEKVEQQKAGKGSRYGLRERVTKEEKSREEWHSMLKERNRTILKDMEEKQEAVYISDDSLGDFVVEDDSAMHSEDWRLAIARESESSESSGEEDGAAAASKWKKEEEESLDSKDPLILALHAGELEQVRLLLKKEHQNLRTIRTHDVLHAAIEGKSLECVKEIVERGAHVNSRQGKSEVTPLLLALSLREESIASYLLERNADVFRSDADGTLPLHMAAAACGIP